MRVICWNVNGLRACVRKGFLDVLTSSKADVVALQEVRAFKNQLDPDTLSPPGWHSYFFSAQRPGYSGVGFYVRDQPSRIDYGLGIDEFDVEGRCMTVHFGRMALMSVYFPKGNGPDRDNSRVPYKLAFYSAVYERMKQLRRRGPVFVMGDYNTAHHDIDLARPRTNRKNSGFLPEERAALDHWVNQGWTDTFRKQHPDEPGHYSWWRQWGDARKDNVGWRIDYVFASPSGQRRVTKAFILNGVVGSDHCPVGIDVAEP